MNEVEFIKRIAEIDSEVKYQYYYKGYPSKTWYTYKQIYTRNRRLFLINRQMLRTGIQTKSIAEFRLDVDTKVNDEKDLNAAIESSIKICSILDKHNITYTLQYSAGSGMHIQFLYDNSHLNKYESSKKVRELICEYLGIIELVDQQLLGPKQTLTCEGYRKRFSKDNALKIHILDSTKKERGEIRKFIDENKFNTLTNENYFKEINTFSNEIINYVDKNYDNNKSKPLTVNFKSADKYTRNINSNTKLPSEKTIIKHLITFSTLYNERRMKSTNQFYMIVCTYLYGATLNYEKAMTYFNLYFKISKTDNLHCSKEQKMRFIISNFQEGKTKRFFQNKYLDSDMFYTRYYELYPKMESNFR